jgi:hypothetical protein
VKTAFHTYPAYQRAYLRALQDIAKVAMNNALVDPVLDAKYAAFAANGLAASGAYGLQVSDPGASGLKNWIGTMHNSIVTALANQGVSNIPFAISSQIINNNVALISGTAPLAVKTIWFNGVEFPITWSSVTSWTATVPLKSGTNQFSVVGVDFAEESGERLQQRAFCGLQRCDSLTSGPGGHQRNHVPTGAAWSRVY